ncbi:hypothetical protein [Polaromonas sp. UC242_47]|uniref:hypothetical protein n=1 Tax=Polaromonas sp. UC242_47 TaxID=3374626 RepID=UPI00378DE1F2
MKMLQGESQGEAWRRTFVDQILLLANNEADMHQVAAWSVQAQQAHGRRDPVEVANEEFQSGTPPVPG